MPMTTPWMCQRRPMRTHVPPTTHTRPSPRLLPRPHAPSPDPRIPTHIDGSLAPSCATTTALATCTLACCPALSLALCPVTCHHPVVCCPATTAPLYAASPSPYVLASPPHVSPCYPSCIYHHTRLRSSMCSRRACAILCKTQWMMRMRSCCPWWRSWEEISWSISGGKSMHICY